MTKLEAWQKWCEEAHVADATEYTLEKSSHGKAFSAGWEMNIELLNKMKDYIEDREHTIDCEWGCCQSVEELISEGAMPEIWHEVCAAIRARGDK